MNTSCPCTYDLFDNNYCFGFQSACAVLCVYVIIDDFSLFRTQKSRIMVRTNNNEFVGIVEINVIRVIVDQPSLILIIMVRFDLSSRFTIPNYVLNTYSKSISRPIENAQLQVEFDCRLPTTLFINYLFFVCITCIHICQCCI